MFLCLLLAIAAIFYFFVLKQKEKMTREICENSGGKWYTIDVESYQNGGMSSYCSCKSSSLVQILEGESKNCPVEK